MPRQQTVHAQHQYSLAGSSPPTSSNIIDDLPDLRLNRVERTLCRIHFIQAFSSQNTVPVWRKLLLHTYKCRLPTLPRFVLLKDKDPYDMLMRDKLVDRVGELLKQARIIESTTKESEVSGPYVDHTMMAGFRSSVLSFLLLVYDEAHPHYVEFKRSAGGHKLGNIRSAISILQAVLDEIAGDWLLSLKTLVSAEVFSSFVDMATHLLEQQYKDPAAVLAGSVLEEHLRQLCLSKGIPTQAGTPPKPKKADTMNGELAAVAAYSKLDQKAVTTWLDLRNKAAHGRYSEYNDAQVQMMIHGITEFTARITP